VEITIMITGGFQVVFVNVPNFDSRKNTPNRIDSHDSTAYDRRHKLNG
jgi:hypothetical protein